MPTLGDLAARFGQAGAGDGAGLASDSQAAPEGGETKTASPGGNHMNSLTEIYLAMSNIDKTAAAAANVPDSQDSEEDFAKAAEELAEKEASELAADEPAEDEDHFKKIAAEYDAAGRIMARGFFDEFMKCAGNVATQASPNQHTESLSMAKTPALGTKGLPTMETNFAGSPNHDQPMSTKGGKEVYKDSMSSKKKVSAGVTGDNPEAGAISTGGGAPAGFATIKDLMG
jgi:hypothetical protein